jgi:hypothetical protein
MQIVTNATAVAKRFGERSLQLNTLANNFYSKKKNTYQVIAKGIVFRDVYHVGSKNHTPTFNLLNSVDTIKISEGTFHGLKIFINPMKVPGNLHSQWYKGKATGAQNKFKYYPSYVVRGIFFKVKHVIHGRPFVINWRFQIGGLFLKEFRKEVVQKALRLGIK